MQTTTRRPNIATREGREALAQSDQMARPAPAIDPFADGEPNPGPTRARAAVEAAATGQVNDGRARAAAYAPANDTLFLRDVEGQELEIYSITMGEDQFGLSATLLVALDGDVDNLQVVRCSGFAAKTLGGVLERIEAGDCQYPLLAQFDQVPIAGGKSCWRMS